jgi:hypothetical protein
MGLIDALNPARMSRCQSLRLNGNNDPVEPHYESPTKSTQHSEKKKKKKKRVGFVSRVNFRKHTLRRDMTSEEIQAAWFSGEEFVAIRQSCEDLIQMLDQEGESLRRDTNYNFRGLESNTRICLAAKLQNRADAFRAVLDEQDNQWVGASVVDDEAIRKAYQGVSNSAQLWAHTVGLHDQREAEDIMDELPSSLQLSTRIPGIITSPQQVSLTSPNSKRLLNSSLALQRLPRAGLIALVRADSTRTSVAANTA